MSAGRACCLLAVGAGCGTDAVHIVWHIQLRSAALAAAELALPEREAEVGIPVGLAGVPGRVGPRGAHASHAHDGDEDEEESADRGERGGEGDGGRTGAAHRRGQLRAQQGRSERLDVRVTHRCISHAVVVSVRVAVQGFISDVRSQRISI